MLRVLHVIYDDLDNPWVAGGGAVRAFELYRRLATQVDAHIVTGNYPGAARRQDRGGIVFEHLGAARPYGWSRLSFGVQASRLLRSASYDAAIVDFSSYTPILLPRGRPVGLTVHHLSGPTAGGRWGGLGGSAVQAFERASIRRARHISAVSAETLRQVRVLARPGTPLSIVSNGVADDLFELDRRPADFILYFGRLDIYHKGIDTLLEAYALLAREGTVPELRLAGRGKDAGRVAALAAELGIADRVKVIGAVPERERRDLLAGALLQVIPSRFEGFGMVAAEAMAAGVPVIAARAGALPEVLGEDGVLVPVDEPPALASAIQQLLKDGPGRATLAQRARAAAATRFRWEGVAKNHLEFIESIATAGRDPAARAEA